MDTYENCNFVQLFKNKSISNVEFNKCKAVDITYDNCEFNNVIFNDVIFHKCKFKKCKFKKCKFSL